MARLCIMARDCIIARLCIMARDCIIARLCIMARDCIIARLCIMARLSTMPPKSGAGLSGIPSPSKSSSITSKPSMSEGT